MKSAVMSSLPTIRDAFKTDSAYWGERSDWFIAYSTTRDADCLGRSNWIQFIKALGGVGTEGAKGTQDILDGRLAIEEAKHWACGWVQYLIIAPDAQDLIAKAIELTDKLEDYPVLNEEHWSELESDDYCRMFTEHAQSEFRRYLKDVLSDVALDRVENAPIDVLIEWFEAQIPSGEYQIDGYPSFDYAFRVRHSTGLDRNDVAKLLKAIRANRANLTPKTL